MSVPSRVAFTNRIHVVYARNLIINSVPYELWDRIGPVFQMFGEGG